MEQDEDGREGLKKEQQRHDRHLEIDSNSTPIRALTTLASRQLNYRWSGGWQVPRRRSVRVRTFE